MRTVYTSDQHITSHAAPSGIHAAPHSVMQPPAGNTTHAFRQQRPPLHPPPSPPAQVVIIPIPKASTPADVKASMLTKVDEFKAALEARGVKVATDTRENYTPGWKYNHWELKGVPLRMELGPMDMDKSSVVLARRDTGGAGGPGWGCVMY
jgi:hypothetical protein